MWDYLKKNLDERIRGELADGVKFKETENRNSEKKKITSMKLEWNRQGIVKCQKHDE